jgi:dihydroanticapsin dehydrogenase
VTELTEDIWDRTMDVNVKSQFLLSKHVIPIMQQSGGGSIINTASANSFVAEPRLTAYVSSKGAILMLTRAMALDYAKDNIRVNCICPGWVDTTFNDAHANLFGGREAVLKDIASVQPIGRPIEPIEIAKVATFLESDDSSALTGSPIIVRWWYYCGSINSLFIEGRELFLYLRLSTNPKKKGLPAVFFE